MKAYSLIITSFLSYADTSSVHTMSEPKRNILNFGYGINFKYEGMLSHSFDSFYVVTKFILSTINDLSFSTIDFYSECSYLNVDLKQA